MILNSCEVPQLLRILCTRPVERHADLWPPIDGGPPRAQVLINVRSVGLNFRDVLNVLGLYPGDPGDPGGDCAGLVAAVGSAVGLHVRWGMQVRCSVLP